MVFDEIHFLLGEGPDVPVVAIGWMLLVTRVEGGADLGTVSIEGAAKHFREGERVLQRVATRVHADEASAGADPPNEALDIGKRKRARGVAENNGIDAVVAQGLRR